MLAIEIEFLMGRSLSTQIGERDLPEWPPHPQRLFSALVAAHFQTSADGRGEAALRWLENLPAPEICVDLQPAHRQALGHWVPVNDEAVRAEKGKYNFQHPLDRRLRQERFFPAVIPEDPIIVFQWPKAPDLEIHREALSEIVENVTYLGHSASPVRACVRDLGAPPTLIPSIEGERMIRVPGPGRFERLIDTHRLRLEDEAIQPPLGRIVRYAPVVQQPHSVFSTQSLTLAFQSGPRLALDSTIPLMQHIRDAVLARLDSPAPPCLSGHTADGKPATEPHLAFVPLAHVHGKHADGSLKGVALVLPRGTAADVRRRLLSALAGPWPLHLGPLGSISVAVVSDESPELISLKFSRYAQSASSWATVTPIVLDKHPKKGRSAEKIISDSCVRIGLPAPVEVRSGHVSAIIGSRRVRDFHGQSKQTTGRVLTHALLRFGEIVRGPLLLGAGRFIGLGVCLPFDKERK